MGAQHLGERKRPFKRELYLVLQPNIRNLHDLSRMTDEEIAFISAVRACMQAGLAVARHEHARLNLILGRCTTHVKERVAYANYIEALRRSHNGAH